MSNGEASINCYARINDGNHYMKMTGVLAYGRAIEAGWLKKNTYMYATPRVGLFC